MTKKSNRRAISLAEDLQQEAEYLGSSGRDVHLSKLTTDLSVLRKKYKEAIETIKLQELSIAAFQRLKETPITRKKIRKRKFTKPVGGAAVAVVWNDWHLEEVIDPNVLEYPNEHNLEIGKRRFEMCIAKAKLLLDLSRTFADVNEFHVFILGDLMSNYLHEESVETNELGPTEAMLEARDRIETGVMDLHEYAKADRFKVTTCHGNHGRLTHRRRYKVAHKTNLEWQVCEDLKRRHAERGSLIEWQVSKSNFARTDVLNWKVRLTHGDDLNHQGGIGGLTIPLLKACKQWDANQKADYTIVGHWHQFIRLWNILVCGCACGFNEYAQGKKMEGQPPTQTFILFDSDKKVILAEPLFIEPGHVA